MLGTKTNKKDTQMISEQVNILNKQIESLASVIQQQVRMKIDAHLIESKNQKRNNQLQMLNQIMIISNWIKEFDSTRIDEVFKSESNFLMNN